MHNNNNGQQSMSGIGMMDMLKNNMMTMVMMKGMNGDSNKKDGKSDIFGMLYVFIVKFEFPFIRIATVFGSIDLESSSLAAVLRRVQSFSYSANSPIRVSFYRDRHCFWKY